MCAPCPVAPKRRKRFHVIFARSNPDAALGVPATPPCDVLATSREEAERRAEEPDNRLPCECGMVLLWTSVRRVS